MNNLKTMLKLRFSVSCDDIACHYASALERFREVSRVTCTSVSVGGKFRIVVSWVLIKDAKLNIIIIVC